MADGAAGPLPVLAGRYRAVERLGAGGMGVVWRARDELLHREVAVKEVTLDPKLPEAQRAETRERTMREARAAARLGHPSIVAVHDVVAQDGRPWIVMDLVRGRSLDQVIRAGGPLPPHRVAAIGLAVLDALALAHSRGIMHRDVKPANIMLADDGGVLLTDFGIATVEGDVQLTSPDAIVGSPGYIAPERLRGQDDGPAADLWSLGATLYAAVEGRGPFHRGTPVATLGAVLTQETPFPSRAGELTPVLLGVLAKDPRERPGEAGLRAALRRVAQGLPAGPLAPSSPAPPTSPVSSRPLSPSPSPEGAPGRRAFPGRRAGLIAGAVLAATALVVTGVLLTGSDDPEVAGGTRPLAGGGRFATVPDACSLLDDAQSRAVVPGATPRPVTTPLEDESRCDWGGSSETRWLRLSLTRKAATTAKSASDVAHEFFVFERTRIDADKGEGVFGTTGALRNVSGVGAEAFGYATYGFGRASFTVRFRISNALIEVDVSQEGERPDTRLRGRALDVARRVAEKLNSRD